VASGQLAGWRRIALQRLRESIACEVVLIIDAGAPSETMRERARRAVWRAIDGLERLAARRLMHRLLARVNGYDPSRLNEEPIALGGMEGLSGGRRVGINDAHEIEAATLDIIVDLRQEPGAMPDPQLARLGIWSIGTEAQARDPGLPLGFWEFARGEPLCEMRILAHTRRAVPPAVVASAWYCTYRWSWSVNDTLLGLKASWLLLDAIGRAQAAGTSLFMSPEDGLLPSRRRSFVDGPAVLARTAMRGASEAMNRVLLEDRWRILLAPFRGLDDAAPLKPVTIEPPAGRYWADPFLVRSEEGLHMFVEEYIYRERRGVIAHVLLDRIEPGRVLRGLPSQVVMDRRCHLSYPFLFTHAGRLYMMPETSAERTIELWEPEEFPLRWRLAKILMSGVSATDSSLLHWQDRWWLFTNIDRNGMNDHRNELHVFHAPDPIEGPWQPHAANPVLIDARCARMAGGFLSAADGRPVRCGQVQGRHYGMRVTYRLITELTPTRYAETELSGVAPVRISPGARTHHVAVTDGMLVADECQVRSRIMRILKSSG
jgi:hypothetical protein